MFSRGSILILRFLTFHMILYKFSYDFDFYFGFEALNSIGYGGDDRFYAFWDSRLCKLHFFVMSFTFVQVFLTFLRWILKIIRGCKNNLIRYGRSFWFYGLGHSRLLQNEFVFDVSYDFVQVFLRGRL